MSNKKERTILDHVGMMMAAAAAIALVLFYIKGLWTDSYTFPEYRRSIVFIASAYLFTVSYLSKRKGPSILFALIALLYNPLSISFFVKGWFFIDILATGIFIFVR